MSVHFNLKRLRPNLDGLGFLIDVGMILLVIANLSLILFDWIYRVEAVQSAMETYTPDFYRFYSDSIHANFFEIDLAFVSVYLTEFVIRWAAAIARQTYHRWFFYPFVHWYDLLGCIPVLFYEPTEYAAFVSHMKAEAAMEARFLQIELESQTGEHVFLDSDDLNLLTAKASIYLINMSEKDFIRKKNKWLPKIAEAVTASGGGVTIPFSVEHEQSLLDMELAGQLDEFLKGPLLLNLFGPILCPIAIAAFTSELWISLVATGMTVTSYYAIFIVANELEDPFGCEANDELRSLHGRIARHTSRPSCLKGSTASQDFSRRLLA